MTTDPQPINLNYIATLSKVIENKKKAKDEIYNLVIELFTNNEKQIEELLTKFKNNLFNINGYPILFDINNYKQILICYTDLFSITKHPVLFDFSNKSFLIIDENNQRNYLNKEQTITLLSNEECFNTIINIADPNKLLYFSAAENNNRLSILNKRLEIFDK